MYSLEFFKALVILLLQRWSKKGILLLFSYSSRAKPFSGYALSSIPQKHFSMKRVSCSSCKNWGRVIVKITEMIHAVHVRIIIKRLSGYRKMLHLDYVATYNL